MKGNHTPKAQAQANRDGWRRLSKQESSDLQKRINRSTAKNAITRTAIAIENGWEVK